MTDAAILGRFVWHELMTTDTKSTAGFFAKVAGWKTQPWPQDPTYAMFVAGRRPVAGLMVLPEEAKAMGAPPNWLTYMGTPSVDDTTRLAVTLGGKILKAAADIPAAGRFAVLQDPQGAVFAVYTPVQDQSSDAPAAVGDFSWHELATTDWLSALTFYRRLFGWEATSAMEMGPGMGTYQMFGRGGRSLGGMFNKPPQMQGPAAWLAYIRVGDAKKTAVTVKKLGGQIMNGPMEVAGGGWIAQGVDLQGAVFAVHSSKPAAKKARPKKKKPVTKKKPARKTARRPKKRRR